MSSDEDDQEVVVQPPEFDSKVTLAIIETLQKRGSNVLMDELIEAANDIACANPDDKEWDVARVLDVLISLNVAAIEKQRGNSLRNSRAFAYRSGYALPKLVKLDTLSDDIAKEEAHIAERLSHIKRLKSQLEKGKSDSDVAFLKAYKESRTVQDATTDLLDKVL